jgi:uncharacterized protein YkwD
MISLLAGAGPTPEEGRLLELANRERKARGLGALEWDDALAAAARWHSSRMAEAGFFSHEDPERGGLRKRLQAAGVKRAAIAENLHQSQGYPDPAAAAVRNWLRSEGHRRNLLGNYRLTGVGVWRARDGSVYVTQIFAR